MGKRQALDNLSVNRRRQMPRIPDRENKFSLEQQRTIVPGELTYAESTKGIRVMSDGKTDLQIPRLKQDFRRKIFNYAGLKT